VCEDKVDHFWVHSTVRQPLEVDLPAAADLGSNRIRPNTALDDDAILRSNEAR